MSQSASHVLVTGGAGFIGSHLVEHLVAEGHRVTVVDDLSTGTRENLAAVLPGGRVALVCADVAAGPNPRGDTDRVGGGLVADVRVAEAERTFGPIERIVHLAAQVSVVRSIERPLDDLYTNLLGTVRVLELARQRRVQKVVVASSAAVYGDGAVPAREADPARPLSPYGLHKYAAEHHVRLYAELHAVPGLSLRFFNVFGPRQSPTSAYAGVISIFLARALRGEPLTAFSQGATTRDFVWVGDVAGAIAAALWAAPGRGEVFNVGTGRSVSIAELGRQVIAATRSSSELVLAPARVGDIAHSQAEVSLIAAELGWGARTSLAEGLVATARWMGLTGG
jgi:UDP-glucose 4-epimerase